MAKKVIKKVEKVEKPVVEENPDVIAGEIKDEISLPVQEITEE